MQIDQSDACKDDNCKKNSVMSVGSNLAYAVEDYSMHTLVFHVFHQGLWSCEGQATCNCILWVGCTLYTIGCSCRGRTQGSDLPKDAVEGVLTCYHRIKCRGLTCSQQMQCWDVKNSCLSGIMTDSSPTPKISLHH
jgi:hypothetical protein